MVVGLGGHAAIMTLPLRIPQLSFDRVGSGPPLLLLHGIGTGRADFTALVPALSESFDVIAMDLPGHGESAPCVGTPTVAAIADMVEHDLDAHGVGKVHVLGNSLGGRVALELAKRGRALSVVAMSPSGAAMPAERMIQGTLMAVARIGLRAGRPAIGVLAKHRAGRIALLAGLRARPWRASEAEALALRSGFASATKYWGTLVHAIMLDVPANLGSIKCPVVLTLAHRTHSRPARR